MEKNSRNNHKNLMNKELSLLQMHSSAQLDSSTFQSPTAEQPLKTKRRTRRKILKATPDSFPCDLIQSLPAGITYVTSVPDDQSQDLRPGLQGLGSEFAARRNGEAFDDGEEEDIVRIGHFFVDVGVVSKDAIKSMRTYWPMEDYRLLKNRKSARICRLRRKCERINNKNDLSSLKQDNQDLRSRIRQLETKLFGKATTACSFNQDNKDKDSDSDSNEPILEPQLKRFKAEPAPRVPDASQDDSKKSTPTQFAQQHLQSMTVTENSDSSILPALLNAFQASQEQTKKAEQIATWYMNNTPKLQPAASMGHLARPQPLVAAPSLLQAQKLLHGNYDLAGNQISNQLPTSLTQLQTSTKSSFDQGIALFQTQQQGLLRRQNMDGNVEQKKGDFYVPQPQAVKMPPLPFFPALQHLQQQQPQAVDQQQLFQQELHRQLAAKKHLQEQNHLISNQQQILNNISPQVMIMIPQSALNALMADRQNQAHQ